MRTPYKLADAAAARITTKLHQAFRHNRLALFDEMNILSTRKHIKKLYANAEKIIKKEFLAILSPLALEFYEEALAMGFDGDIRDLDEAWLEEFLGEYNPVTKYVYSNEIGRKESRLFEAIVASSAERHQSYKTAENLLTRQVKQYADNLEDEVAKAVYKDAGVKKVKWVAEQDHKTCSVCSELDGEIFLLKDAPEKQHYHCRCYLVPVK